MTTIRRFCCDDLLRFASVNLDHLTETVRHRRVSSPSLPFIFERIPSIIDLTIRSPQFNMSFYMTYLARWPDYFHAAVNPGGRVMGYSMSLVPFASLFGCPGLS